MKAKPNRALNVLLIFVVVALCISVFTLVLQNIYKKNTLTSAVTRNTRCADAVYEVVTENINEEDVTDIVSQEDMTSQRYQELQSMLNQLRKLNSTRYLYTATWGKNGQPIYLVDGLSPKAEDFRAPGVDIEPEMVGYITSALNGNTTYSDNIMDTTWGHIFSACYPIRDNDTGEVVAALCIEIDMETSYYFISLCNRTTFIAASIAIILLVVLCLTFCINVSRQSAHEKEQQRALKETAEKADAANKAKSTFLFNMSHDIRTPMNAVLGYVELADRNTDNPELLHQYLTNIRSTGKDMMSLLDNVLELARIESGNLVIEPTPVAAETMLEHMMVMLRPEADKKQQTLTMDKDLPYPYVYMDEPHMVEIGLNIISNSIKYTGVGGRIHCVCVEKPHPDKAGWCNVVFTFTDDGIGMSEGFLAHVYESFSRERSTTASGVSGTGLGMGIVKKLVDAMDGTIHIQSQVGVGTTVAVEIPAQIATEAELQPERSSYPLLSPELRGKRILLAEDNELNAEIATELLADEGLIVQRAENGVECIEMLERAPEDYYSLILMDIQMPVLNGYDASHKIRLLSDRKKAGIPIIAMTANAFAEDREKAVQYGMNDHVSKPIDLSILIPTLEKYL